MISGNFYVQSGTPFNMLVPHVVYGNNQGIGVPRGTAVVPVVTATEPGFPNRGRERRHAPDTYDHES